MSLSTILTILIAIVILIIVFRFVSGLLRFGVGLIIVGVVVYWLYTTFIVHGGINFFK